jgi:hypothetical protein
MIQNLNILPWFNQRKRKKIKIQLLLEDSVKSVPIKRSKRTTPSIYRGRGGQDVSAYVVKNIIINDSTNHEDFLEL